MAPALLDDLHRAQRDARPSPGGGHPAAVDPFQATLFGGAAWRTPSARACPVVASLLDTRVLQKRSDAPQRWDEYHRS